MGRYFPRCVAILQCVFDGFGGGDSKPHVVKLIPRTANVHLTGYKEADTFDLSFDVRKLPFSPELLRTVGVEIFVFQTEGHVSDIEPYLQRTATVGADNLAVSGSIDRSGMRLEEGGKFRLDGRDNTSFALDKKWPSGQTVPAGKPLDVVVHDLMAECTTRTPEGGGAPYGRVLKVRFIGPNESTSIPVVGGEGVGLTQKKVKGKAPTTGHKHTSTKKRGLPVKSGKNYWDVIYGLCLRHGFICYVKGDEVIISTPQTLVEDSADRVVRMAYGRNLKMLEVERKYSHETTPQVVVTSYDPVSMQTKRGEWPLDAEYKGKQTASGVRTLEQKIVTIAGITSVEELRRYARNYHGNIGRSESKITFSTRALSDLSGTPKDLCHLRPGDPIGLKFDPFNRELLGLQYKQNNFQGMRETLLAQGFSSEVAGVVVEYFDRIHQFERPFYTKAVQLAWDSEAGLALSGEAINYVAVERDSHA